MTKKRIYNAESVERVSVEVLLPLIAAGCIVAIDAAKTKFVVALASIAGEVLKLLRFEHPRQTRVFLSLVDEVRRASGGNVVAAMEPTGTYGDAVRQQLVDMGIAVQMVSPKRTHDSRELFDGVPSMHDPKSATLIAKLSAMGLGKLWTPPSTSRVQLRALVDMRREAAQREEVCCGRLEAVMARHWPEFGRWMDARAQKSATALLVAMPSPKRVVAQAEEARALVQQVSRGRVARELVEGLITSAATTTGVAMVKQEEEHVRVLATHLSEARRDKEQLEDEMKRIAEDDDVFARLAPWMGTYTAAVVVTHCDPRQYTKARQLEKACGLNLREKSSGNYDGKLHITKRGPGVVRQALYLFALRTIEASPIVRAWYVRRRAYTEEAKRRAVVAVMRKLVRALFHVAKGNAFDATKLFDTRRLVIDDTPKEAMVVRLAPRTTPRKTTRERRSSAASLRAST